MKIYTKRGDDGTTGLAGGTRISKSCLQLEVYGTIDELNSVTGVALEEVRNLLPAEGKDTEQQEMVNDLLQIQHQLFTIGGILATESEHWEKYWSAEKVSGWASEMETKIDRYSEGLPPFKGFILPSGSKSSAQLHVARTVCRRAERLLYRFWAEQSTGSPMEKSVSQFINRLSDFYFVLARVVLLTEGKEEVLA
ncbi:MAG: cob(I)yrinic acid a,c-diamide adenosyltransferase [Bacteroidales bacterium]|nr:cob(I)yrinic acid a,c-diamide adenosyltransferase [Bacteroidales bacterium]